MNKTIEYIWFGIAILLLFYAFDSLVLGLTRPLLTPTLNTLTDKIIRVFISIVTAAGILFFLSKND